MGSEQPEEHKEGQHSYTDDLKEIYPWLSRFHDNEKGWSIKPYPAPPKPEKAKVRRAVPESVREIYPWVDKIWSAEEGWILNKPPDGEYVINDLGVETNYEEKKTAGAMAKEQSTPESSSDFGSNSEEKNQLEAHRTISRIPDNPNYYEKDGLRTYGDGQDHDHEPKMTFSRFMVFVAMGFLWTGSQIGVYLFGGIIPEIVADIGGEDRYVWLLLGNLIPLASVTPFVGALADLFGRKTIAIVGATFLIVGHIVVATAQTMNVFIGGQVISGIGAGISELISLAVTAEQAPTSKRGLYVGLIIITIIPYCPSVIYAQEIVVHSTWRWIGLWVGLWCLIGAVLTAIFFKPPPRVNARGLTQWQKVKRIDITGGVLSTGGVTLFLGGLSWAGGQYAWSSPHVLAPLILGIILIILFILWERFCVRYPMFPRRLNRNPRVLAIILIITAVSGANFFAVLVFWPSMYFAIYAGDDPVSVGVGSLPVGFGIIGGSIIFSVLLTIFRGKIKWLMLAATILMTAGSGAMACATLDNLNILYLPVCLACIGVGAVIIPNQVIATIICPDDLIATITAATVSARILGGAIGYTVYYNILKQQFTAGVYKYILPAAAEAGVDTPWEVADLAEALAANLKSSLINFPHINTTEKVDALVYAGRQAFADAYPQVYYAAIGFGAITIIAAAFLPDISRLMDDHVAVAY